MAWCLVKHRDNFTFTIRKVQENHEGLKLNGTHQIPVYANSVCILDKNKNTIKRKRKPLLQASREVDLEVNTEKTKYIVMSHHQNAGQIHIYLLLINPLNT
jgi:hypothetical protein